MLKTPDTCSVPPALAIEKVPPSSRDQVARTHVHSGGAVRCRGGGAGNLPLSRVMASATAWLLQRTPQQLAVVSITSAFWSYRICSRVPRGWQRPERTHPTFLRRVFVLSASSTWAGLAGQDAPDVGWAPGTTYKARLLAISLATPPRPPSSGCHHAGQFYGLRAQAVGCVRYEHPAHEPPLGKTVAFVRQRAKKTAYWWAAWVSAHDTL